MKIQCNICNESPIVDVIEEPKHSDDLIECPVCYKLLAYSTEKKYSKKLIWNPIDTEYNQEYGTTPVSLINK